MARKKVSDEHRRQVDRERSRRWRAQNPQRNAEIQARYLIKKAVKLLQQSQIEGASK